MLTGLKIESEKKYANILDKKKIIIILYLLQTKSCTTGTNFVALQMHQLVYTKSNRNQNFKVVEKKKRKRN